MNKNQYPLELKPLRIGDKQNKNIFHFFFWQHKFVPILAQRVSSAIARPHLSLKKDWVVTYVIEECKCGRVKGKVLDGGWELKSLLFSTTL